MVIPAIPVVFRVAPVVLVVIIFFFIISLLSFILVVDLLAFH